MRKRVCGVLLWGTSLSFLSSEAFRTDGGLRKRPATWSHSNLLSKTRLRVDDMDSGGESAEREMDLDDEIMLNEVLRENAPSELQVRMNLMGVTPLTIAGFALAFVIIILNNALGYGWASELLGLDPSGEIAIESEIEIDFEIEIESQFEIDVEIEVGNEVVIARARFLVTP